MIRINKATLRTSTASIPAGLSSNRDVWVYTSSTAPIPIIRNEELILIYAEANIQLNNFDDAIKALNIIRTKHGLANYSGAQTQAALIDEMLYERRYSLYFEGHDGLICVVTIVLINCHWTDQMIMFGVNFHCR